MVEVGVVEVRNRGGAKGQCGGAVLWEVGGNGAVTGRVYT